jgi:hypothetical protein
MFAFEETKGLGETLALIRELSKVVNYLFPVSCCAPLPAIVFGEITTN